MRTSPLLIPAVLLALARGAPAADPAPAATDTAAQIKALEKELGTLRDALVKGDPDLAKQRAAVEEARKKFIAAAEEKLVATNPHAAELKAKLTALKNEAAKATEGKAEAKGEAAKKPEAAKGDPKKPEPAKGEAAKK